MTHGCRPSSGNSSGSPVTKSAAAAPDVFYVDLNVSLLAVS